jgi:serine/threonine protein phosphatase PrpC
MHSSPPAHGEGDDPVLTTHALVPVGGGATDIGQREHNEDHILLRPELGLFLLADGAGGHNAGNVASALATTTVANVFETTATTLAERPEIDAFGLWTVARRLSSAIHRANAEIIDIAKRSSKYKGMGTTLVALAFSPGGDVLHIAHVGDSRCYRVRAGEIEAMTTDHSLLVDVLEAHPDVDDALLERTPSHAVTRALGMEESLRVPVRTVRALAGDVYLLCSDGVTDVLDDDTLGILLLEHRSPDALARGLVDAAVAAQAQDNMAVVVVECQQTDVAPRRRPSPKSEPPRAMRGSMSSAPEIIIVGVETHIVPSQSADPLQLDALGLLARLRPPVPEAMAALKYAQCGRCGQPLEKAGASCPTCGHQNLV